MKTRGRGGGGGGGGNHNLYETLLLIPLDSTEPKVRTFCIFQEKGHTFTIHGEKCIMYGTVAAIAADNLGSLALGGFKESCTAFRMCRHCMATSDTAKTKVYRNN